MSKEKIIAPEIDRLKTDEFYLFYEMMMQSLKTDDVKEGLNKSLSMLRTFINSGNIALFRKNKQGTYDYKLSDSNMDELILPVGCIINKTKQLSEQKTIFNMNLDLSERLKNLLLIHINISNSNHDECIMMIINNDNKKELEPHFWERVKDTMQIILKRASSYERNVRAVTTDLLTGLDNRNSYEMRVQSLNESDDDLVVGVFDLFRLKYVNDNYTHAKGDEYIVKAAEILNKYWPKYNERINENGIKELVDTGHTVYRFGGDEFVLMTTVESLKLTQIKAELVRDEAEMINLGVEEKNLAGINFGIVSHFAGDYYKKTFITADEIMKKDKEDMYKRKKIDRRH